MSTRVPKHFSNESGQRNANFDDEFSEILKFHNHRNFVVRDVILNGDYSNSECAHDAKCRMRSSRYLAPYTSSVLPP